MMITGTATEVLQNSGQPRSHATNTVARGNEGDVRIREWG